MWDAPIEDHDKLSLIASTIRVCTDPYLVYLNCTPLRVICNGQGANVNSILRTNPIHQPGELRSSCLTMLLMFTPLSTVDSGKYADSDRDMALQP